MLTYQLPENLNDDIEYYENAVKDYLDGKMETVKMKGIRVPLGIYEQRRENTYMVRVRVAGGIITPAQLKEVSRLALKYGSGILHVTTRQDLQMHDISIQDTVHVIKGLVKCGLGSKGGGGNTVRNIVMSHDTGCTGNEPFELTPVVTKLTSDMINEKDSFRLPRKFKISFSNNDDDTGYAMISDLGLFAKNKDGEKGFRVFIAGGLGRKSRVGELLYDFIPLNDLYRTVNAVKAVFYKYGNRKNKHRARLRFLFDDLGKKKFLSLVEEEKERFQKRDYESFVYNRNISSENHNGKIPLNIDRTWFERFVTIQPNGFYNIMISLKNGDIRAETAEELSSVAGVFGENTIRLTNTQNIFLVNVPFEDVKKVHNFLEDKELYGDTPYVMSKIVACKGADTCKLGICKTRGAVKKIYELIESEKDSFTDTGNLNVHISGCPNACGKHLVGDIGFYGRARQKYGYFFPSYTVVTGGCSRQDSAVFGHEMGEISAKNMPYFLTEVLKDYAGSANSSFHEYLENGGKDSIDNILSKYSYVPSYDEDFSFYYDWGSDEMFSTEDIGQGECSASLMDLIDSYLKSIRKTKQLLEKDNDKGSEHKYLYDILLKSVNIFVLLKGYDTDSVNKLVDIYKKEYQNILNDEQLNTADFLLKDSFSSKETKEMILELSDYALTYYRSLDDNLGFAAAEVSGSDSDSINFKDYRGVACPLNFVRIKVDLSSMKKGEILEVYLDDGAPIANVPRSVEGEGHEIVGKEKIGNYWSLKIKKN